MGKSSCPHVVTMGNWSLQEIAIMARKSAGCCFTCGDANSGQWLCLYDGCGFVGCGEKGADHSTEHSIRNNEHSLMVNLNSHRIWCHTCEVEVFPESNAPASFGRNLFAETGFSYVHDSSSPSDSAAAPRFMAFSERPTPEQLRRPLGLAGLQNLGNTCYMNAALQALSNCPQLTQYFLTTSLPSLQMQQNMRLRVSSGRQQQPCANLATSYAKLIKQMWHEKRPPYVVPSGVAYGIKSVCPMFRGASQQDAQEFLRCFLDQLHDELKEEFFPPVSVEKATLNLGDIQKQSSVAGSATSITGHSQQSSCDTCDQRQQSPLADRRSSSFHLTAVNYNGEKCASDIDASSNNCVQDWNNLGHSTNECGNSQKRSAEQKSVSDVGALPILSTYEECLPCSNDFSPTAQNQVQNLDSMPNNDCMSYDSGEDHEPAAVVQPPAHDALGCTARLPSTNKDASAQNCHHSNLTCTHQQDVQCSYSCSASIAKDINSNNDDDFETCDSGLSSEKSEASLSDQNNRSEHHKLLGASLSLLIGELQELMALPSSGLGSANSFPASCQTGAGDSVVSAPKKRSYRSIISDVFDGHLISSVQCFTCESISSTKETFQDLSLPIPSKEQIERLRHVTLPGNLTSETGDHLSSASSSTSLNTIASTSRRLACSTTSLNTTASGSNVRSYQQTGWIEWLWSWLRSWMWGPSVPLIDCLAAFFSADELKGDNMYSCGKCNKLRNGIKYSKVLDLPEVLCIHLKRFRHELLFSTKISNHVSFPLEGLDMALFTHPDCRDKVTSYDLVAVICHHGTVSSGHYTAYALNEISQQWYEFDDTYVIPVDASVVTSCEAYVLFYRKTSEMVAKRLDHCVDLIRRSQIEVESEATPTFYISRRWVNRFYTFAEPGPIDNSDFGCPHGFLNPFKADRLPEDEFLLFSQSVWEYLLEVFKGGPAITRLEKCTQCLTPLLITAKQGLTNWLSTSSKPEAQKSAVGLQAEAESVIGHLDQSSSPRSPCTLINVGEKILNADQQIAGGLPIESLLDNVVNKMTTTRVTDQKPLPLAALPVSSLSDVNRQISAPSQLTLIPQQDDSYVKTTHSTQETSSSQSNFFDIEGQLNDAGKGLLSSVEQGWSQADSAFCSPMDSVDSQGSHDISIQMDETVSSKELKSPTDLPLCNESCISNNRPLYANSRRTNKRKADAQW